MTFFIFKFEITMSKYGVIPNISYKDPEKALRFLKDAFGFSEHSVFRDDENNIQHGELKLGNAMIMISPVNNNSEFRKFTRTPNEIGGYNTQTPYIVIEEIDSHYKKAIAGNAKIILDIKDEDYGGRGYSCKDTEGNIWSFGSYDPYSEK